MTKTETSPFYTVTKRDAVETCSVRLLDEHGLEVFGNGWPQGGVRVASVVCRRAIGGTIGPARYAELYDDATGEIVAICDFRTSRTADAGTDFKMMFHNCPAASQRAPAAPDDAD